MSTIRSKIFNHGDENEGTWPSMYGERTEEDRNKTRRTSESKGPFIIQDTMNPTFHPATGEIIDSKSEFRKRTKAAGCIEVGNEQIKDRREWDRSSPKEILEKAFRGELPRE